MNDLAVVIRKNPEHEFTLRRLYASNSEFKRLCEDYAIAVVAFDRWKNDKVKATQYCQLIDELDDETVEFIEGRHPHQFSRSIGN